MIFKDATSGGIVIVRGRVRDVGDGGLEGSFIYLFQVQQFITPNMDDVPIKSFEDKLRAMELANNPVISKRTQLILVKHHFMVDAVRQGK